MKKLHPRPSAVVGLVLLLVGAVALVAGVDAPGSDARAADGRVIWIEDGRVVHSGDIDEEEIERIVEEALEGFDGEAFARDLEEALSGLDGLGEEIAAAFEGLDFDADRDYVVRRHRDREDEEFGFDHRAFERRMERMAERLERRLSHLDDEDFAWAERMADHGERVSAQVQRAMERVERRLAHEFDDRRWEVDRDPVRHERQLRREIRQLERRLERLQHELEELRIHADEDDDR